MNETAQSLQALLGRIGAFFDIFDLSFVVSGASSLAALLLVYKLHGPSTFPDWLANVYGGVLLVLSCYVLGMLSFVLGRLLRRILLRLLSGKSFSQRLAQGVADAMKQHDLRPKDEDQSTLAGCIRLLEPLQDPKLRGKRPDPQAQSAALRLYTLMWTQIRQQSDLTPSHILLSRYWVMAALCDGMVVSSVLWLGVLLSSLHRLEALQLVFLARLGVAMASLATLLFLREAERYAAVQVDDLVSTLAWDMSRPRPVAQQGSMTSSVSASAAGTGSPASSPLPGHPTQ